MSKSLGPDARLGILCALTAELPGIVSEAGVLDALAEKIGGCPGVASVAVCRSGECARGADPNCAAIPVGADGDEAAVILARFAEGVEPDEAGREFFAAVGRLGAQALERIRKSERAFLEKVLESLPSGVSIAEAPSGKLVHHNSEAVRLLRHPLLACDDASGYVRYGAMHDERTPYRAEEYPIARALRGETVRRERMLYRRGDGTFTHYLVNAAPVRDESGRIEAAVSTFDDISELMAAQDALQETSGRLSRVLESTTDSILATDETWRITYMNGRAQRSIGRGRNLIGVGLWDAFPNALGGIFEERYRAVMESGVPQHFEAYYEPFGAWFEVHAHPDGGGMIVYFRDITARKLADREREVLLEAARASEAQARSRLAEIEAIYESAPVGLCVFDKDVRYRRINRRLAGMNGLSPEAHIGRRPGELLPQAIGSAVEAALREVVETGEPRWNLEIAGTTPAAPGVMRYWNENWIPLKDEAGAVVGLSASAEEITSRKRMEEELRRSEAQLSLAMEATELGMFDFDPRSGRLEWSAETRRHFGVDPTVPVDFQTFLRGLHPEDRERVEGIVRGVLGPGSDGRYATEFRTVGIDDGKERWIAAWGRVSFDAEGRAVRFIGVTRDITERKHVEEQLRHAQKLESIGVLAGGVAHDFNNLLASIMGNASLLRDDVPPESAEMAAAIVHACERAAELTRQLLAYAGKGRYVLEQIDLSEAVRAVRELLHVSIPRKVTFLEDLDPALPAVEADPGQIHQVVLNLVINAAEAIPENAAGTVSVRTSVQTVEARDPVVDALSQKPLAPGAYVCLEVRDTGVGMDAATRARIFDPFFTTKFTGRGLGLPALAGVVRAHRGAVRVNSTPGRGTAFEVFLPAAGPHVNGKAPRAAAGECGRGTVLVADDEPMVRSFVRAALERKGYRVLAAGNGEEAVGILEEHRGAVDLVLLDLVMPALGGEEVAAFLARTQPGVKVLLMSGYSEKEAERIFAGRPIAAFLQKPFAAARLAERVDEVLRAA